MELWNEYEGRSIDGLFPLERLIRPEGRSAFFSTTTSGTSTVIRLIESHFDEDEILARWTGVCNLHQPNLLALTRFGQAMMDETSLVYVVLEPAEADLSQILRERPLTLAETRQVATSLIPALEALHAKGFLHEHIEPANVLAVGEVVKLRSDCIREAPEGSEGDALRVLDVKEMATLLLQCLTQQRSYVPSSAELPLPAPFREIIQHGIVGEWSLAEMAAALEMTAPPLVAVYDGTLPAAVPSASAVHEVSANAVSASTPQLSASPGSGAQESSQRRVKNVPHPFPEPIDGRIRVPLQNQSSRPQRWLAGLAIAVICLMLFAVYTIIHRHSSKGASASEPVAQTETSQTPPAATTALTAKAAIPGQAEPQHTVAAPAAWRVIAYTYNRQDQAAAKARSLEARFRSLNPDVYSISGRAPFLVTLGGPLSRDAAFSLRDRLRAEGLPRDLYAQNYSFTRNSTRR